MHEPDADNRFQPQPDHITPPASPADLPIGATEDMELPHSTRVVSGMMFGAFVGVLMGPVAASTTCWLADWYEWRWHGVLIGIALGPLGGALIGIKGGRPAKALKRFDIATTICIAYCLVPAMLMLAGGLGAVRGKFSGLVCIGAVFAGPMYGMLIGAIMDSARESLQRHAWGGGVAKCIAGTAICAGVAIGALVAPYGPDPELVVRNARFAIYQEWKHDPEMKDAMIRDLELHRQSGRVYSGVMGATVRGQMKRFTLEVVVDWESFTWKLKPLEE